MNLFHFGTEFRRFAHGKLPKAAFVVMVLLPLIFGGLFPWSYWDPIGNMKNLPVALVNSDQGADANGQHLNAGEQVENKLLQNNKVHFIATDAQDAKEGVETGKYYFSLEFPTDFSEAVVSVNSDQPRSAQLNTVYNNANGFIATMLGNQVTGQVVSTMDAELGSQVTNKMLVGFNTVGAGMQQAAGGAQQLHDGAHSAREGAEQLAGGNAELAQGASELNDGANQLASGASALDEGLSKASSGASQLNNGLTQLNGATDQLGQGASQISAGVDQIVGLAGQAGQAQSNLVAPLVNVSTQLRALGIPPALDLANQVDALITQANSQGVGPDSDVQAQLAKLQGGAATLAYQLSNPAAEYRSGLNQATAASGQLAEGLVQLEDGSGKLVVGTQTLTAGTSKLKEGSAQLSVGANALRDGLVQLDEGSGELSLKLTDGASQVPQFDDQKREDASKAMAQTVVSTNKGQELTKFGVGLTPFFCSLAMFLGGTIMFMIVRPLQRRAIESRQPSIRAVLASYFPAMVIGLLQATAVWAVLTFALGIGAEHPLGLWIALMGISMSFVAVTQSINAFFGPAVGRLLCIILMAFQLVSSGGLYPAETQPKIMREFHTYDPITYSVNLLRQMIIGSNPEYDHRLGQAIIVLLCVGIGGLVISSLSAYRDRLITQEKLHPELSM